MNTCIYMCVYEYVYRYKYMYAKIYLFVQFRHKKAQCPSCRKEIDDNQVLRIYPFYFLFCCIYYYQVFFLTISLLIFFSFFQVFSNDMLHRMILSVRVKCANAGCGCIWTGELINLEVGGMIL